jgi:hypothetical protein
LADDATSPGQIAPIPHRATASSARSTTTRRRIVVGALVTLLAAGGIGVLLAGGADGGGILPNLPVIGDDVDDERPTPAFAFTLRKTVPQRTSSTKIEDLVGPAEKAAKQVKATLDGLYVAGFVEPDSWGDFGSIRDAFDAEARDRAEADLDTLTLGSDGAARYDYVEPERGTLVVYVLTDRRDSPVQALAVVTFIGAAEGPDGTYARVRSKGSYFLRKTDGVWAIYSYRVQRTDRPTEAPEASASPGSASPTVEASP